MDNRNLRRLRGRRTLFWRRGWREQPDAGFSAAESPPGGFFVKEGEMDGEENSPVEDPFDAFRPDFVPKPEQPTYSQSGVDLTMVRWMLSLTYKQRLDTLQSMADLAAKVKYVSTPAASEDISDAPEA